MESVPKWRKSCCQITIAPLMQPLHYDLRLSAANSITYAHSRSQQQEAFAAIPLRSIDSSCKTQKNYAQRQHAQQKLQLQSWIPTPKRKKNNFEMLFKRNFKGKSAPKCKKELLPKHHPPVTVMQPLQCDLRFSGAKDNISTTQPQQREAFKQPPDYDLQRLGKTHYSKASTTKNKKSPGSLTSNASAAKLA